MLEKLTAILRESKGDDDLEITESTAFADLEFDSLEMVEIVMNVEEEFEVSIELSEDMKTVKDLMDAIANAE